MKHPMSVVRVTCLLAVLPLAAACADDALMSSGAGGGGAAATSSTSASTVAATVAVTGSATRTGSGGDDAGSGGQGGAAAPVCGDGVVEASEACDDGNADRYDGCLADCTLVPPLETPPGEWTFIEVPGTVCMNGETAGFGISLVPGAEGVVLYLEGGGACFDDSCDSTAFSIPFAPPTDGIFNRANALNPVADWSMVYVPYCTGDIHGGDAEAALGGEVRQFRGYSNIGTYLEQWVPTFAATPTVLLTGISAGGFGAGLNFAQVADAFGEDHQMVLVDDSGPPLSREVIAPCLQSLFRELWGLDGTILAECGDDCPDPDDFATGTLAHMAERFPAARVGMFSNTADLVIRGFMGVGWGGGTWNDCEGTATLVPADVYEADLLALRDTYQRRAGTFFVGQLHPAYNYGRNHTVLRSSSFWTTVIDGTSVAEWLEGVIAGEVQHVGP